LLIEFDIVNLSEQVPTLNVEVVKRLLKTQLLLERIHEDEPWNTKLKYIIFISS
jgi:hypothetical protein